MSATTSHAAAGTQRRSASGLVRLLGIVTVVGGALLALAGGATWLVVQDQLAAESITVAEDADWLAGDEVDGPFSAFAQADIINEHALAITEGNTYAELDREDPRREVVMNGSFLRASLFTSVVAFGVAAMAVALGVLFVVVGTALVKVTPAAVRR